MNKLHALIIEDKPRKLDAFIDHLDEAGVEHEIKFGPVDGYKRIEEKRFDVIFIDLQLSEPEVRGQPVFEGIALGEKARKKQPQSVIVLYSGSISKGKERAFSQYEECMTVVGADDVMARSVLFSLSS